MPNRPFLLDTPESLKALAHPIRIKLLGLLQTEGAATATMLAPLVDESVASVSYHLRQLARFGLIEEAVERGDQRDRWWQSVARQYVVPAVAVEGPEREAARFQLLARVMERDSTIVSEFLDRREQYEPVWRQAVVFSNKVIQVRPEQVAEVSARIQAVLDEYVPDGISEAPPDTERVYAVVRLVPWRSAAEDARTHDAT